MIARSRRRCGLRSTNSSRASPATGEHQRGDRRHPDGEAQEQPGASRETRRDELDVGREGEVDLDHVLRQDRDERHAGHGDPGRRSTSAASAAQASMKAAATTAPPNTSRPIIGREVHPAQPQQHAGHAAAPPWSPAAPARPATPRRRCRASPGADRRRDPVAAMRRRLQADSAMVTSANRTKHDDHDPEHERQDPLRQQRERLVVVASVVPARAGSVAAPRRQVPTPAGRRRRRSSSRLLRRPASPP